MKSCEISQSKNGPFSLACTDPYIGREYQSNSSGAETSLKYTCAKVEASCINRCSVHA